MDISIHVSDEPESGFVQNSKGTLENVQYMFCSDIPLETFELNWNGRYVKIVLETFYGSGPGLSYVNINYNRDTGDISSKN